MDIPTSPGVGRQVLVSREPEPQLVAAKAGDIDFMVVRENVEGEYSSLGGIQHEGTEDEVVVQQSIFTRRGVDRVSKYAFELAQNRPAKHLTSAMKSNGIVHSMPSWDSRVAEMAKNYPDIDVDQFHIDVLTANFVRIPDHFDVVVGSNLFGDILSELGPACTGTIAVAPSANLNPAIEFALREGGDLTPDMGGKSDTQSLGKAIEASI